MNKKIGDDYEIFIKNFLCDSYDNVYLWKDVPEKIMFEHKITKTVSPEKISKCDIGIDIVAIKDNIPTFIQCKNYSNNTICINDIAGFSFFRSNFGFLQCKLYYNGKLSYKIMDYYNENIYVNVPYKNKIASLVSNTVSPRDYQLDAVKKLKGIKRSVLNLPCGMGKTYTSLLLAKDYDNIIFFVPKKELAIQVSNFFGTNLQSHNNVLISSDGTRNKSDITIKLKNVFISTYKSVDVVNNMIRDLKNVFIIIDEYHNLSQNDIERENNNFYKILHSNYTILFLSATPKYLENKTVFGNDIYKYDWSVAIKNKYINNFNIVIPTNDYYSIKIKEFINMFKLNNDIDVGLVEKIYFGLRNMLYSGDKKTIFYFVDTVCANNSKIIIEWMSKIFNVLVHCYVITAHTSKNARNDIINTFKMNNDISIILSVHVLDEGIDIVECDSVFILKPSYNMLNIIQRMSRCCRYKKEKPMSNVYLWSKKHKVNDILTYIHNNTNGEIKNNVTRLSPDCYIQNKEKYFNISENKNIPQVTTNVRNNSDLIIFYKNLLPNVLIINGDDNIIYFNAGQTYKYLGFSDYHKAYKKSKSYDNNCILKNIYANYKNIDKNIQGHSKFINTADLISVVAKSKMPFAKKLFDDISKNIL